MNKVIPICSSSQGNAFLILYAPNKAILLDAGVPVNKLNATLKAHGITEVKAVIISHDHYDHVYNLHRIYKQFQCPVFCNIGTHNALTKRFKTYIHYKIFESNVAFYIDGLYIFPFIVPHDATESNAFIITFDNISSSLGICLDVGHVNSFMKCILQKAEYLIIESNYDEATLNASPRPDYIKQRTKSRFGHLSNNACKEVIHELQTHGRIKSIVLAHISKECNTQQIIQREFNASPCHIQFLESETEISIL